MAARGSDRLLEHLMGGKNVGSDELAKAVQNVRALPGFRIVRWWWYGQPAIDKIIATLQVDLGHTGKLVDQLVRIHGEKTQVNFDVFPLGTPVPDLAHLNVTLEQNIQ